MLGTVSDLRVFYMSVHDRKNKRADVACGIDQLLQRRSKCFEKINTYIHDQILSRKNTLLERAIGVVHVSKGEIHGPKSKKPCELAAAMSRRNAQILHDSLCAVDVKGTHRLKAQSLGQMRCLLHGQPAQQDDLSQMVMSIYTAHVNCWSQIVNHGSYVNECLEELEGSILPHRYEERAALRIDGDHGV